MQIRHLSQKVLNIWWFLYQVILKLQNAINHSVNWPRAKLSIGESFVECEFILDEYSTSVRQAHEFKLQVIYV